MIEEEIKKELTTTVGNSHYNGWHNRTSYGYHSYDLDGVKIVGQRNPKIRLDDMKKFINFKDKNVVDFGCNVGAMLHHLPEIKQGFGFDYDTKCITAGNNIAKILGRDNISFYKHDFDKDGYDNLKKLITFKTRYNIRIELR